MLHLNKNFFRVFLYIFILLPVNVIAKTPTINTTIDYGKVVYKSVSKSMLVKFSEKNMNFDKSININKILGFTFTDLNIKFLNKLVSLEEIFDIDEIIFYIGYKSLYVFIDEKYKKGSCEYKAIKEHEDGHVKIYRTELKYYGELIVQEIKKNIYNVDFNEFIQNYKREKINQKLNKIMYKPNVQILISKLKASLKQKHNEYDNSEEYKRVNKLCNRW